VKVVLTGSCTKNSEFDYHMNDDLGRMVLNPDVNVRCGVMEKMFYVYSNDTGLF
jgi:molybdopterin-containing oxidoreductase family iron-sulfur binding subunit